MNITFTTSEVAALSRIYTFYAPTSQPHRLTEKEQKVLHDTLQRVGLLERHPLENLHTLTFIPAEWQEIRDALADNIALWQPTASAAGVGFPSYFQGISSLLQKLDMYELAAYVEEALTVETTGGGS